MKVITNKHFSRSGILRISSRDHAELLARIFYGIELPDCQSSNARRILGIRTKALINRGAITEQIKITPLGIKILANYT